MRSKDAGKQSGADVLKVVKGQDAVLNEMFMFNRDVKQKMEDERREEKRSKGGVKKKRKFRNPFKRRPKTREEKIEAWLEN